jgi:hypothetical protein
MLPLLILAGLGYAGYRHVKNKAAQQHEPVALPAFNRAAGQVNRAVAAASGPAKEAQQ